MENTLPQEFLNKLDKFIPRDTLKCTLASFAVKKQVTLRINSLSTTRGELISEFRNQQIILTPTPWYKDAFSTTSSTKELTSLSSYGEGKFYIQGLSSMIPPLILDPQIDDSILDITAAPGSKTTQIATLMQNNGEIIANDISRTRLFKLKANLKQQHITNTKITNIPGERIWKKYPEYFDKVLVDAPCSMEGRFTTLDPDSYEDWTTKKVKELSRRQKFLLRSALTATRIGGIVVYSTCTLSPEENEEVIDWILEKEGDAIKVEEMKIPELKLCEGITGWGDKKYNPEVKKTSRIWPNNQMEGFFIAKIKKMRSTLTPELLRQLS